MLNFCWSDSRFGLAKMLVPDWSRIFYPISWDVLVFLTWNKNETHPNFIEQAKCWIFVGQIQGSAWPKCWLLIGRGHFTLHLRMYWFFWHGTKRGPPNFIEQAQCWIFVGQIAGFAFAWLYKIRKVSFFQCQKTQYILRYKVKCTQPIRGQYCCQAKLATWPTKIKHLAGSIKLRGSAFCSMSQKPIHPEKWGKMSSTNQEPAFWKSQTSTWLEWAPTASPTTGPKFGA